MICGCLHLLCTWYSGTKMALAVSHWTYFIKILSNYNMISLFSRPGLALLIGVIMAFVLSLILPNIEDITLKIGIPFYVLLLGTATWRFLAKADQGIYYGNTGFGVFKGGIQN